MIEMNVKNNLKKLRKRLNMKSVKQVLDLKRQKNNLLNIKSFLIIRVKKINPRINRNNSTISFLILVIIVITTVVYLQSTNNTAKTVGNTKIANKTGILSKGTPKYKTLLPAGKTIVQLGGWTKVSPPDVDPVYAFVDKIGDISINISQQPLPKIFQTNTDEQIATLASDFNAEEKLTIENTTVYIGTSAKGPQSVIFTKNNLLILIKSSIQISNDKWTEYISSLH